jgi:hypothetical protein
MDAKQLEYMIVNSNANPRLLQDWQVLSLHNAYLKYAQIGGKKTWQQFQEIIRKRNLENNSLERIVENTESNTDIQNINETDIIVIPVEAQTDRKVFFTMPNEFNERGEKFIKEIIAERNTYIYTQNYGWVDRGHAGFLGGEQKVKKLYIDLLNANPGSIVSFELNSGKRIMGRMININIARMEIVVLKKMDATIAISVAFTVLKRTSREFEYCQESTDFIADSSFAEEDLPSNIINFYHEVINRSEEQIMNACKPFAKKQSLWIYKRYHFQKNMTFDPIIKYPGGIKPEILNQVSENREGEYWKTMSLNHETLPKSLF